MQTLAIIFFILFCLVSFFGHVYQLVDFTKKSKNDIQESVISVFRYAQRLHRSGLVSKDALTSVFHQCSDISIEVNCKFLTYEKVSRLKKEINVLYGMLEDIEDASN